MEQHHCSCLPPALNFTNYMQQSSSCHFFWLIQTNDTSWINTGGSFLSFILPKFDSSFNRISAHCIMHVATDLMMAGQCVNMDIYCKNCRGTVLYCSNPARSLPEYGVLRCTVDGCFHQIAICTFCDKKIPYAGTIFELLKNMLLSTTTSCQE